MTDPAQTARRLSSGERVTVRRHPLAGRKPECWEAEAIVPDLSGHADRHAIGDTPDEAVGNLESYVMDLRRLVKRDA